MVKVRANASFFFLSIFLGFFLGRSFFHAVLIAPLMAITLVIHEAGHAVASVLIGCPCSVYFDFSGGQTQFVGKQPSFVQRLVVQSAGILASVLTAVLAQVAAARCEGAVAESMLFLYFLNLTWFYLNLLPLYPFDMGRMLADFLQGLSREKGHKIASGISLCFSVILALFAIHLGLFVGLYVALYVVVKSWQLWQEPLKNGYAIQEQERLVQLHRGLSCPQSSIDELIDFSVSASSARLRQAATEAAAKYLFCHNDMRALYDMLMSVRDPLTLLCLEYAALAAYKTSHWKEGLAFGRQLFAMRPTRSTALLTSLLAARLERSQEAEQWLYAAQQLGVFDFGVVMSAHDFDPVRHLIRV